MWCKGKDLIGELLPGPRIDVHKDTRKKITGEDLLPFSDLPR